ncbi:Transposon TX1 uncharacterized 149 kDa protein [Vitis vinifera]|uniref:Transposon TX1 uncharacterized 149 kDa protein n=1 Tax=Vitis vinifera TaxID=29760 RepID=A0A438BNG7_VITVI|nr:Transposon TX1 uncharacterized 149 kDa protein [Vitis vinifera]
MTKKISDFRPISLITSLYKIIAKVLSGCLRGVLYENIHSTQGTFVQGRQILDVVLIANEIVDEKRRSGKEGVVFKIDFEKAYDHVSWDFLDHVLEKKGFSPRWRKWMRGCLSTISYAVLVNGNAKRWVKASRGLRQGDSLSPFLFTLVADVLSRMLLRADERNSLEGFRTHLSRLVELLDWKASGWSILYLGLLLGGNPKIPASVAAKIDRLQRDFLWSGVGKGKRDHLVSWDVVCNLKAKGGLGFGKISLRNLALLGKWLWSQMVTSLSLEAVAQVFQEFSKFTRFVFSLLSSFGILKSLSKSSHLSAWRIGRSSFPTLLFDDGVVAQIISVSQDGLGSLEEHFRHAIHQL